MKTFFKLLLILSLGGTAAHAVIRIMPLGDSITYDARYSDMDHPRPAGKRSAYRNYLWYFLEDAGYPADFVGSQIAGQDIRPPFDPENEGHPGWTTYDIAEHAYEYMANSAPDIVLLHIGTNDRTTTNPAGVGLILDEIDQYEHDSNHHIKVFVALIIDRQEHDGRIEIFNRRLKDLLLQRIAAGDDIVIVDMYHEAGLTEKDYADNTHPNNNGYYKMAKMWYTALVNNPYNPGGDVPDAPGGSVIPAEEYPEFLVPAQYIESKTINGNTVEFLVTVPDNGIVFK
jgi:hypothetical protein